jgi:hypothetical protein
LTTRQRFAAPSKHFVDRLRSVCGQGVRVLIEAARHPLRLIDPRHSDLQSCRILLAVKAIESHIRCVQRTPSRLEMAARVPEVDAVDVQARIEHWGAPFEQAVAELGDLERAIDGRLARRPPHPSTAERNEHRQTDSKNALHHPPVLRAPTSGG